MNIKRILIKRPVPASPAQKPKTQELALPHERDEMPPADPEAAAHPREVIKQAARDIARGLRDTDRRGIPSDVPGPGIAPESSPGADVPPEKSVGDKERLRRRAKS